MSRAPAARELFVPATCSTAGYKTTSRRPLLELYFFQLYSAYRISTSEAQSCWCSPAPRWATPPRWATSAGPRRHGPRCILGRCSRPIRFVCGIVACVRQVLLTGRLCAGATTEARRAVSFSTGAWFSSRTSGVSKPATALRAGEAPSTRQCEGWRAWLQLRN